MKKRYSLYTVINLIVIFNFIVLGILNYYLISAVLGTTQIGTWIAPARYFFVAVLVVIACISVAIKLVLTTALTSVVSLRQQVKEIVQGEAEKVNLKPSRYKEVNELHNNFEAMAKSVKFRQKTLRKYAREVKEKNEELKATKQKLASQIENVKQLHKQLLADRFPDLADIFFGAHYQPARKIGGDFYDVVEADDKIIYYLVDVTGHGLEGAFLNVFIRETINNYLLSWYRWGGELSPQNLMEYINQRYRKEGFPDDYFISLVLFMLDKKTNEVVYTNAGVQSLPLVASPWGIRKLESSELPISGAIEADVYQFSEKRFKLSPETSLLLTTDGLIEEENEAGERYGLDRLKKVFAQHYELPPKLILEEVKDDFAQFTNCKQQDDITLLAVRKERIKADYETTIISNQNHLQQESKGLQEFLAIHYSSPIELLTTIRGILHKLIGREGKQEFIVRIVVVATYIKVEIKNLESKFHWKEESDCSSSLANYDGVPQNFDYLCYNNPGRKAILIKYRT